MSRQEPARVHLATAGGPIVTDENPPRSAWAESIRLSDLGLRLVIAVVVGCFGGLWLDRQLAIAEFPWFAVSGAVLGFAAGLVSLVRGLTRGGR